jgi:hypothetical protein
MRRNIAEWPPLLRRERRPAGDRTAALENHNSNNNRLAYSEPVAVLQAAALHRLRRQRHVKCICRLGPRVVFELLDEIGRHHGIADDIDRRLARYAAIDLVIVAAVGSDQFAGAHGGQMTAVVITASRQMYACALDEGGR